MLARATERWGSEEGIKWYLSQKNPHPKNIFLSSLLSIFSQKCVGRKIMYRNIEVFQNQANPIEPDLNGINLILMC